MREPRLSCFSLGDFCPSQRIFICFTEADWNKNFPDAPDWLSGPSPLRGCVLTYSNRQICICVAPERHDDFEELVDTLAHESVHAVKSFFENLGEDEPSEEIEAHLVGSLTGWALRQYFKKRETLQ